MSGEVAASGDQRTLLRHALATIGYRATRAIEGAPPAFATYDAGGGARSPIEILAHMGDLMDWALSAARGAVEWHSAIPKHWDQEASRFFKALVDFDAFIGSHGSLGWPESTFMQGPVADALTHVGQLTLLRRAAGAPVVFERYSQAPIVIGKVDYRR